MAKTRRAILAVLILAVLVIASYYGWSGLMQKRRDFYYRSSLAAYSRDIKPDMTRLDVEAMLKARGIPFFYLYANGAYETDIPLGDDPGTLVCAPIHVRLSVKYRPVRNPALSKKGVEAGTEDRVQIITLDRSYRCL